MKFSVVPIALNFLNFMFLIYLDLKLVYKHILLKNVLLLLAKRPLLQRLCGKFLFFLLSNNEPISLSTNFLQIVSLLTS